MPTTITINGTVVVPAADDLWIGRLDLARGRVGALALRRVRTFPADPSTSLLGAEVRVEIDGEPVFAGDVVDESVEWTASGWSTSLQARCLRDRGDRVPLVDDYSLSTTADFNRPASDPLYRPDRSGKTLGQAIAAVLTMADNAAALDALGIGGYTSLSPPTLPVATAADLAALDRIPPQVLTIAGDKLLSALASALEANAPNHDLIVLPDGVLRVLDRRDAVETVVSLGDCGDRARPPSIRRSVADCHTAVELWGRPVAEPKLLSLSNGGLVRAYKWGAHATEDDAEAAWTPEDFLRGNRSVGSCVATDTLHVAVDPADNAQWWTADVWDQSHWGGMVMLTVAVVAGVASTVTRRVVANTPLTAGGTSVLTLDEPLPALDYTRFELYGKNAGAGLVYRRYRVADPDIRAALARKFSAEAVWTWADGQAATTTLYPTASVVWYESGAALPSEVTDEFTIDGDGYLTFARPTFLTAGKKPDDVKALLAVNVASLQTRVPASGHEGNAHDDLGLERPLKKFVKNWTDPLSKTQQDAYARELLDSVKDVTVDVSLEFAKLWKPALDWSTGLSIASAVPGRTTGLETANLPLQSASITWKSGEAATHATAVRASNRRESLQPEALLAPERPRQGFTWGTSK